MLYCPPDSHAMRPAAAAGGGAGSGLRIGRAGAGAGGPAAVSYAEAIGPPRPSRAPFQFFEVDARTRLQELYGGAAIGVSEELMTRLVRFLCPLLHDPSLLVFTHTYMTASLDRLHEYSTTA